MFRAAGIALSWVARPSDAALLPAGAGNGPAFANTLAGEEIGAKVRFGEQEPGGMAFYANTLRGYRTGVITHVGIVSVKSKMIHRRPKAYAGGLQTQMESIKMFQHDGRGRALRNGADTRLLTLQLSCVCGVVKVKIDGKWLRPENRSLQIFY